MKRRDDDSIPWEEFKAAFHYRFFPIKLKEAKMMDFMKVKQGSMSVREYSIKFNKFSKYAPHLFADHRARMNKFVLGVSNLVNELKEKINAHIKDDLILHNFIKQYLFINNEVQIIYEEL
ncbi:MAG: hypothetical protein Q8838_02775 [Candidatus Phytoplasma australasiaticum]|nr:hypothetical protein [Candidatus Phytoplasma australasiaticum]